MTVASNIQAVKALVSHTELTRPGNPVETGSTWWELTEEEFSLSTNGKKRKHSHTLFIYTYIYSKWYLEIGNDN